MHLYNAEDSPAPGCQPLQPSLEQVGRSHQALRYLLQFSAADGDLRYGCMEVRFGTFKRHTDTFEWHIGRFERHIGTIERHAGMSKCHRVKNVPAFSASKDWDNFHMLQVANGNQWWTRTRHKLLYDRSQDQVNGGVFSLYRKATGACHSLHSSCWRSKEHVVLSYK